MKSQIKVQELLYGSLLAALAILIPTAFGGWLQIYIPPFSATLGSHVPTVIAMFISPWVAALVGVGSAFGFMITLGPVIALRAAVHIVVGVFGAKLVQKGYKSWMVLLLTAIPHALGEAIVVIPFGFDLYSALVVVGIGTFFHHGVDFSIGLVLKRSLDKVGLPLTKLVSANK